MSRPETDTKCDNVRDLIDACLDGAIGGLEKAAVESHLVSCAACAEELALARRIEAGLHELAMQKCPASVSAAAIAYASTHPLPGRGLSWWLSWRPVLAGAVAVILLLATAYVGQNGKQATPQYSRAELEQARAQAKWTLVFINQLSRKTASNLKRDVLDPHVVRKMMRLVDPKLDSAPKENTHAS